MNNDEKLNPNYSQAFNSSDLRVSCKPDDNINDALMRFIKENGMTIAEFSKKSGITEPSLSLYKNKKAIRTLETIVIACIVTKANIFQSLYLITLGGYNVVGADYCKVYFLLIIMSRFSGLDIRTANSILENMDMKPLCKNKPKKNKTTAKGDKNEK